MTILKNNLIITIGRQYASGGHEIARELSQLLGIKMYDKELIDLAAENSGISRDVLKAYDEKPTNSFLYSLSMGTHSFDGVHLGKNDMPISEARRILGDDFIIGGTVNTFNDIFKIIRNTQVGTSTSSVTNSQ